MNLVPKRKELTMYMEQQPIRLGVVGTGRGSVFMSQAKDTGFKLVAICDNRGDKLDIIKQRREAAGKGPMKFYTDFDEMLKDDEIDAIALANYFHEHAPMAIKALKAGKHVLSECAAINTLAEGVELCRTVEETGKIYMIAENYPFTKVRLEMKRLYESGELGELLYGEGEYCHPMDPSTTHNIAPGLYHWRNQIPSTYYCTHAIAPIMHITNTVPTKVNGFVPKIEDQSFRGSEIRLQDSGGIIVCQMSNGAVVRTLQGAFRNESNITTLHCTHGNCEMDRVSGFLNVWHTKSNRGDKPGFRAYSPSWPANEELANKAGHGGGDFWVMYYFGEAIRNNEQPWLNVYRACAMSAIGILAWKSACNGGITYDVPKFDDEEDRKKYENDHWTPFRKEGQDDTGMPPRTLSNWKPLPESFEIAKKAWEERKYMGLGWTKADAELSNIKM